MPAITVVDNGTNDEDSTIGRLKYSGLPLGKYHVKETQAPEGYIANPKSYGFTVANSTTPASVNCGNPIVNQQKTGTLTWRKVDSTDTALLLTGSEWLLVGPDGTGTKTTSITNCVAADVGSCSGPDKDPAGGKFTITGLGWGNYTLTESKAPAGYVNSQQSFSFTVDATHLTVSHGPISNTPRDAVNLPLTGGLGCDAFLIGGFGILSADTAATGVTYVIRRRKEVA